jgi:hypothetical protein
MNIKLFVPLLAISALSVSCGEKPTPTPTPKIEIPAASSNITMPEGSGTATITFTSSADWNITTSDTKSPEWLSVSPMSGTAGSATVTVTVKENDSYDSRTGYIKITAGTASSYSTVSQKQKDALLITANKYEVGTQGGAIEVEVKSNMDYKYTINGDWIKYSSTKALTSKTLTFTIANSEESIQRQGSITFTSGGKSEKVDIYQAGEAYFVLTSHDFAVTEDEQTVALELRSNVGDCSMSIPDEAKGWISEVATKGISVYTKYLKISKNVAYDLREATITVKTSDGSRSENVRITQAQHDALVVAKSEYGFNYSGGMLDLEVGHTKELTVSIEDNAKGWISVAATKSYQTSTLSFGIAESGIDEDRSGEITLSSNDGKLEQTVKVVQKGLNEKRKADDRAALVALFNATGGANWINKTNWCTDADVSSWYGVTVNGEGRVIELNINENNMIGTLPPEIGALTELFSLNLGWNHGFGGTIPREIGNLKKLGGIILTFNAMTGTIPDEFYNLTSLSNVRFDSNNFTGGLSSRIGNLKRLTDFSVAYNHLSGPIPKEIGQLSHICSLRMDSNEFTGEIPDELGNLGDLVEFAISSNKLEGQIPITILQSPTLWRRFWPTIVVNNDKLDLTGVTFYPAPEETLKDVEGEEIKLPEVYAANELTLLYEWFTWCPISAEFTPKLIKYYQQYHSKGLEVIGYSDENSMTAAKFKEVAASFGMPWRNCFIESRYKCFLLAYGLSPSITIVDKSGNTVFNSFAWRSSSRDNVEAFLAERLGGGDTPAEYYASTDYSADGKVATLQTHTAGNGIRLIFTGDAFTDKDHADGTFDRRMKEAAEHFFEVEPYKSLSNRFDVYSVAAVSKNHEIAEDSETAFGTWFGAGTKVGGKDEKVFEYAQKVNGTDPAKTLIVVVINSPNYSGTCWMYEDQSAIAYLPITGYNDTQYGQLIHHEAGGHGFGKLLDEYAYAGAITTDATSDFIYRRDKLGWGANVDITSDPVKIQWRQMLSDSRYKDLVGIYEGGLTYSSGAWRPTYESIMRQNTGGYNAPSRQAIYKRIMKLSESKDVTFEDFCTLDAPNRTASASKASARLSATSGSGSNLKPMDEPVFVRGSWRDAK